MDPQAVSMMNLKMWAGKASELSVAAELLRCGIAVYTPCVDDQDIDMVLRVQAGDAVRFYDVQVKSVKGHNQIVGVHPPCEQGNYLLIVQYRHDDKPDETFYLTREQVREHLLDGSEWGDLRLLKADRERLSRQTLRALAEALQNGAL